MSSSLQPNTSLDAESIAALTLQMGPPSIAIHQTLHRIDLTQFWEIQSGEKIVEIGCGQGDCTVVLASVVGEEGHVTAIDPAPLDYGSPVTLGEAQGDLKSGPLGSRITFVQADPRDYLRSLPVHSPPRYTYDSAVLAHSIWYFASPDVLGETVALLSQHVKRICIAEYALSAGRSSAVPHLLAALAQASLESKKPTTESNIRTILSPDRIKKILASKAGMEVVRERVRPPHDVLEDGRWEINLVKEPAFDRELEEFVVDEREKAVVHALKDSMLGNLEVVKASGEKATTMDVWSAVFGMTAEELSA